MNDLTEQFARLGYAYQFTPLEVRPDENNVLRVHATAPIASGVFLGNIRGTRKYVWEVVPSEFTLFVDDECVIDMSDSRERDVFAYVREDVFEGLEPTCELVYFGGENGFLNVGFRTLREMEAGDELVFHRSQELYLECCGGKSLWDLWRGGD